VRKLPARLRRRAKAWQRSRRAARVEVRAATHDDATAMLALWERVPPGCIPPMTAERLHRVLERCPGLVLLVEDTDGVVGTIVGTHDNARVNVYGFAVHPARRRRAVGTAMLAELERRCAALGFERVYSLVQRTDEGAMAFCRAAGYTEFQPPTFYRYTEVDGDPPPPSPLPTDAVFRFAGEDDLDRVVDLWVTCDLVRNPARARYEAGRWFEALPMAFVVGEKDGEIVAASCASYDGMQSWGWHQAVHPDHRRKGYARALGDFPRHQGIPTGLIDWHGGLVQLSNELSIAFGRAVGNHVEGFEWAYVRKRLPLPGARI
jgi:ribosomal protein S18 acetylase RimI-like enzyme